MGQGLFHRRSGKPSGEILSVIHEEAQASLSGDSDCTAEVDLQVLEEDLFRELPASTKVDGKRSGGGSLPKHNSSARDNATQKVLSAHGVNKSGSKRSGCPRPLAPSSQKRPANVNTTKAINKDLNLPKVPESKPKHCLQSTTTRSVIPRASHLKHNQIAQPGVNIQKQAALKGSSNNSKSVKNNAKAGPDCKSLAAKSSVRHTRGNMANSPLDACSSTKSQPQLVTEPTRNLEMNPDPVSGLGTHLSGGLRKTAVSLVQNGHGISGGMQYVKLQTAKPSGLRMPSPSLGFFGQPKGSASESHPQRNAQPCNISKFSIANLQKTSGSNIIHEEPGPWHAMGEMAKVINDATRTGNIRVLKSNTGFPVPSAMKSASQEKLKLNLEVANLQNIETQLPCDPKSSEPINNQRQLPGILDDVQKQFQEDGGPCMNTSSKKDSKKLQMIDDKLLSKRKSGEHLKQHSDHEITDAFAKSSDSRNELENPILTSEFSPMLQVTGVSGTDCTIDHQYAEDKQCHSLFESHIVISGSESRNIISCGDGGRSMLHNDSLNSTHDVSEQSREEAELVKPYTCETDLISHMESDKLLPKDDILCREGITFEELQKSVSRNTADVSSNGCDSLGIEVETSHSPSQLEHTQKANKGVAGVDSMVWKLPMRDEQMHSLDGSLSIEGCIKNFSVSVDVGKSSMAIDNLVEQSGELPKPQSPFILVEQISQGNCGSCPSEHVLLKKSTSGEHQEDGVLESAVCVAQAQTNACGSEPKGSNNLLEIQPSLQDGGIVDKIAEHPLLNDAAPGYLENSNCFNVQCERDLEVNDQVTSLETNPPIKLCEDPTEASVTTCSHKVTSKNRGSDGSELENLSEGSPLLQVNGISRKDVIIEHQKAEDEKCLLSVKSEFGYAVNYNNQGASIMHVGASSMPYINEQSGEQSELLKFCVHEANQISDMEIQRSLENDGISFVEATSCEGFQRCDMANSADAGLQVVGSSGNVLENSCDQLKREYSEQSNEDACGVDNMTKNLHAGCAQELLDGNLIVENCKSYLKTSVVQKKYVMVGHDVSKQSGEQTELHRPHPVVEQVQLGKSELCFSDLCGPKSTYEELQEENVYQCVLSARPENARGSETKVCTQETLPMQYADADMDKMIEHSAAKDVTLGSTEMESAVENCEHLTNTQIEHDIELSGQAASMELDSSSKISKDQVTGTVSDLPAQKAQMLPNRSDLHVRGVDGLEINMLVEEADSKIAEDSTSSSKTQHGFDDAIYRAEETDAAMPLKDPGIDKQHDDCVRGLPLNAVPFSDEWLAAVEAAGEDILSMKTGAVQNSPPDKSESEPGPWSPVKRKSNQAIGPFDCTKYTNIPPPNQ
ncbi:uncharacterized protein LOC131149483 isoform X2 [Malania oleifera]|uniref:uncharacterized protein LOC131149483 isoform X2 n=1 Tax=Malania oleifera TaxID=397392 RepID=UPI0025AEB809|nr:uncharacterized protein LOC131149483 isoform X2 [Malania oleifera]